MDFSKEDFQMQYGRIYGVKRDVSRICMKQIILNFNEIKLRDIQISIFPSENSNLYYDLFSKLP